MAAMTLLAKPAYDAVVFDCDGVLVDSERLAVEVTHRIVADLGWETDVESLGRLLIGCSSEFFLATLEEHLGRKLEPGWDAPYAGWREDAFAGRLEVIPGIVAALDGIDLPWAVASNSRTARIRSSLATVGLLDRFEGRICSAEDEANGKPAPDVYLSAARLLGVAPGRCIAVDDSPTGVLAAQRAGMFVLAFADQFTAKDFPSGDRVRVFTDMRELPRLVAELRRPSAR